MHLNPMEDFRRDVVYRCLVRENGDIALTANLTDRFHDIEVTVILAGETLEVISAQADFRKSPTPDCPAVAKRLARLHGFRIGKGLQRKLMEALGGEEGCGNLRTLLSGLLPLALNVRASRGIVDEEELLDTIHEKLRGSCAGYANPAPRRDKE